MKRLATIVILTTALLLAACSSAATPTAAPDPTKANEQLNMPAVGAYPAETETNPGYPAPELADPSVSSAYPPPYAAGKTTGVAAVDKVLAALSSSNPADMQVLLVYASAGCTKAEGLGGPPKCKENEAEGTQVEGIPVLGSEGTWTRKGEVPADFLAGPFNLLGVYEVNPPAANDPNYPAGNYAVIVTQTTQSNALLVLRVSDAGIVRIDYNLQGVSGGFSDAKQFLLPLQQ